MTGRTGDDARQNGTPRSPQAAGATRIAGFELIARIGKSSTGTIYKARQLSLDRLVALEVLAPRLARNAAYLHRFRSEARAVSIVSHVNVIHVFEAGQDPATKSWYLAMEYVNGPSLRDVLDKNKLLPEADAFRIVRGIACALDAGHRNGITHGDLRPGNILLTAQGEPKLAGLGLAREVEVHTSPAQTAEAKRSEATRSDLYALGALLFHLVTGRTLSPADSARLVAPSQGNKAAPRLTRAAPRISGACAGLITALLAEDAPDRLQTAAEVVDAVDALLASRPPRTPAAQADRGHGRKASSRRRRRSRLPSVIFAMLLLCIGAAVAIRYSRLPRPGPERAAVRGPARAAPPEASAPAEAGRPGLRRRPESARPFGGHWYQYYGRRVSWRRARERCRRMGGYLACIGSKEEDEFIARLINRGDTWLGGSDAQREGTWTWISGEPFRYTNWRPNEPNDWNQSEDHLSQQRGLWNDFGDHMHLGFVCEWEF